MRDCGIGRRRDHAAGHGASQFATDADQSSINEQTVDGRQAFQSRTAEVRFSGRAFDKLDWTVGGFFLDARFHSDQTVSIPALIFAGVYNTAIRGGASVADAEAAGAAVIEGPARFLVNGQSEICTSITTRIAAGPRRSVCRTWRTRSTT